MSKARLTVLLSILLILAGLGLVIKNSLPFFVQADVPEVTVKEEKPIPQSVSRAKEAKKEEKEVKILLCYPGFPSISVPTTSRSNEITP